MRRSHGTDNTAYPLTDLMTSLMVIFVLLLLVFLNNQASEAAASSAQSFVNDVSKDLSLTASGVKAVRDPRDYYTVIVQTPIRFQPGQSHLNAAGRNFLESEFPKLAKFVCDGKYRNQVEEVIVEGRSDRTGFSGLSYEDSFNRNLRLSQQRAMEVVSQSILPLGADRMTGDCLAGKITASGRSSPETEADLDDSRRVEFKIKMLSDAAMEALKASKTSSGPEVQPVRPEVIKVLDLFRQLRTVPRQAVAFDLSQDEMNTYLEYALHLNPRPGVESIKVKLFRNNYVSTLVRLDLDALERNGAGELLAPFHLFLNGKKELWLDFHFEVKDSRLTFTVEKSYYQRTHLPIVLVNQLIRLAAGLQPEHLDTSEPIPLPFNLKRLRTEDGRMMGEN